MNNIDGAVLMFSDINTYSVQSTYSVSLENVQTGVSPHLFVKQMPISRANYL